MELSFERGDRTAPVGHALIYFRSGDGSILGSYIIIPPIQMDFSKLLPPVFSTMMQGIDFGSEVGATPLPPIPETVSSVEYLQNLAQQREDDLIFGGNVGDLMSATAELGEASQAYYRLYADAHPIETPPGITEPSAVGGLGTAERYTAERYSEMNQQEQLTELSMLTGRLRDSLSNGHPDPEVEQQMRALAEVMPGKYRVSDLIEVASIPGERGQRLAELFIERSYKLLHEEYLDLERIDRDIAETRG
jgi:hypothetical protein